MGRVVRNERGGMVKLLVWLIVIGGVLYAGYSYFQQTPRYTLMQFKRAIMFSNAKIGEECLDMDRVISDLPESVGRGMDQEAVKRRILSEIDTPYDKGIFSRVKKWSTFTVPIEVNGSKAGVEQEDGTIIELEQTEDGRWLITSMKFTGVENPK